MLFVNKMHVKKLMNNVHFSFRIKNEDCLVLNQESPNFSAKELRILTRKGFGSRI